jgi:hypothetical protein
MVKNLYDLSAAQLRQAVQIKEQIEKLQSQLSSVFGFDVSAPQSKASSGMSEATKAKLRAAAKKRWANVRSAKPVTSTVTSKTTSARKPMSAAARARLSALMKAKWAAKNKGTKSTASAKKAAAKKPTMSPAAKAKLSALAKARWAKIKVSGKKGF